MSRRPGNGLFSWARALAARARRRPAPADAPPQTPPESPDPPEPRAEAPADAPAQAPPEARPHAAPEPSPEAPSPRQEILARLESWLTETLADEPPPPGLDPDTLAAFGVAGAPAPAPPEPPADRVSLCSALTALTQEIKLQGRAFKQLDESLSPLGGWGDRVLRVEQAQRQLAASVQEATAELRRQAEAAERAQRAETQAVVRILLDLYDRLQRGLASSRRCLERMPPPRRPGLWSRILRRDEDAAGARAAVDTLAEGYGLTLARLLEALRDLDISPVGNAGETFDPHTMAAVSVVEGDDRPEGTVLEVYAPGFVRGGDVLRAAKVSVAAERSRARPPASPPDDPQPPRAGSFAEPKAGAPSRPEPLEHAP